MTVPLGDPTREIQAGLRLPKASAGRGWTRESLYDERIGRWQKS